eukprot:Skav226760  [mRNA]  locus=scaffold8:61741:76989:+ [translate_table: standard]
MALRNQGANVAVPTKCQRSCANEVPTLEGGHDEEGIIKSILDASDREDRDDRDAGLPGALEPERVKELEANDPSKPDLRTVAEALAVHAGGEQSDDPEVERPRSADLRVVAEALAEHGELTDAAAQLLSEATPFRVSSNPVKLLRLHAALRAELTEGIRLSDPAQIRSAINRGASLSAHYYTSRMQVPRSSSRVHGTSKGPKESLVNPVDWAVLEGFYQASFGKKSVSKVFLEVTRNLESSPAPLAVLRLET